MKIEKICDYLNPIGNKLNPERDPGFAYSVLVNGEIIHSRAFGAASLEYIVPISIKSMFYLASVSKQFTATCALKIFKEHNISINSDAREFICEIQQFEKKIPLKSLLNHTSGIPDYFQYLACQTHWHMNDYFDNYFILEIISKMYPLYFLPGQKFEYSNSNYVLLAKIIEILSNMTLRQYAHESIFKPLGMRSTVYDDNRNEIIPGRVQSYWKSHAGYMLHLKNNNSIGCGGVLSNLEDLAKWENNFFNNILHPKSIFSSLTSSSKLPSGGYNPYVKGVFVDRYDNIDCISHSGAFEGFQTAIVRIPKYKISFLYLCNCIDFNIDVSPHRIIRVIMGEKVKKR